jgi:deoxyadenosine/deoxycytidine kinase
VNGRHDNVAEGRPRFIAVEGPIGVGKTTLARRLADSHGTRLLLEEADHNPFLPRFYEDPVRFALPTQLYFLFQRAGQIQALCQDDLFYSSPITDFMIEKDRLFARVNLADAEYDLYDQVYERVVADIPAPDLVIYLQAAPEILMQRIRRRGIAYEQLMVPGYLEKVCAAYVDFFYRYERAPMLIVNTAEINIADDESHYRLLLEQIDRGVVGKHYFNPVLS